MAEEIRKKTRLMIAVKQSMDAFEWTLDKIIGTNTAGFEILILHVEEGSDGPVLGASTSDGKHSDGESAGVDGQDTAEKPKIELVDSDGESAGVDGQDTAEKPKIELADFFVREGLPPVLRLRGGGNICKCFKVKPPSPTVVGDHMDAPGGDVAAGTISYADIVHITDNFSEDRVIGDGGSAIVYRGTFDGKEVAVKFMVIVEGGRIGIRDAYYVETGILRNCDHQNIVSMVAHGLDEVRSVAWVVSEFMPNRTLRDRLRGADDVRIALSWEIRLTIAIGVARAITYLHTCHPPIVHMDIKSANILLDSSLEPKLADFGVSRTMPAQGYETMISPSIGTTGYVDPGFIRYGARYGAVIPDLDIYSFGILLLELISGRGPHPDFLEQIHTAQKEGELIDRAIRPDDGYAGFREHVQLVVDLAHSCTAEGERPNAAAVLRSLEAALRSLEAE